MPSDLDKKRLGELLNTVLDYTEGTLGQSEFSTLLFQTAELIRDDRILPMLELLHALCRSGAEITALIEVLTQTVREYPMIAPEDTSAHAREEEENA